MRLACSINEIEDEREAGPEFNGGKMKKKLSEMSLEELWKMFPIYLTEYQPSWKEWYADEENLLRNRVPKIGRISHIGSTAIHSICAKPIIDIAVAVHDIKDILPYIEVLKQHNIFFHEGAVAGEVFFVMEDGDIRTHHIHIVKRNGTGWSNYISFRDYLNANPEKAMMYDEFKRKSAVRFADDRKRYTASKQEIIGQLLSEANM